MAKFVEIYKSKKTGEKFIRKGNRYQKLSGGALMSSLAFQNGELEYVMTGTLHKGKPQIR